MIQSTQRPAYQLVGTNQRPAYQLVGSGLHADDTTITGFEQPTAVRVIWGFLAAASVGISAFHGYRRHNGSIGWAIGWGLLGGIFPVIVPAIAFAQGISTPMKA